MTKQTKKQKIESGTNLVVEELLKLHAPDITKAEELEDFPREIEVDNESYLDIQTHYKFEEIGRVWKDGKEFISIRLLEKTN